MTTHLLLHTNDVSTKGTDPEQCNYYTYTITRTWTATDACNNNTSCIQTITVQDVTKPVITCPVNVTANCQDDLSPTGTGSATATDNCDNTPAITYNDVSTKGTDPEQCNYYTYTITRTWTATDACNNNTSCIQTITVQDVTKPVITCPVNVTANCQDDLSPTGTGSATATDNCDNTPAITYNDVSTKGTDPEQCNYYTYTITRTWTATDACNNNTSCIQTITVQDVTKPVITCPINVTANCQDDLSPMGTGSATATDNCDNTPAITYNDVSTKGTDPEQCNYYTYTITRTWTATDACNNNKLYSDDNGSGCNQASNYMSSKCNSELSG
ncbi:MAG: hypothetical protein IPN15_13805 [Saprospiraceae bacterium]|nr:hypothetical protein [Candidatus Vicinibacter affinis]